ncbi:MAG: NAD(P)/FAD-dependent oxidoreductase [Ilumatobacteraceae bacterium]
MRIAVIGGGIAGVSVAAELSVKHDVTLLEMEPQLAHHTTGRSAAMFLGSYGNNTIQELSSKSLEIFHQLSEEIGHPILTPRDMVQIFDDQQLSDIEPTLKSHTTMEVWSIEELCRIAPYIARDRIGAVLRDTSGFDVDVAAMHQAYVKRLMSNDGAVEKLHEVISINLHHGDNALVSTGNGLFEVDLVINASGAWGNVVAERAGCSTIPLHPLRRTIFTSRVSTEFEPGPMILRHPEEFYFRIDRGVVIGSPADESPSEPCDARPEEIDVAMAIEAINELTTLAIRSVETAWAGLRTFASDRTPVVGFNRNESRFFWLCGQGGYGIQMSPKLAALAANAINGEVLPDDVALVEAMSPARFVGSTTLSS